MNWSNKNKVWCHEQRKGKWFGSKGPVSQGFKLYGAYGSQW